MRAVVLQSNYLPWKGYFHLIKEADVFVFYDCVKYTKNDWRNRNKIYAPNGLQWITIPISSTSVSLAIDEVLLPKDDWKVKHMKMLTSAYGRAPHFKELMAFIDEVFQTEFTTLSALNQFAIRMAVSKLGLRTKIIDSRELSVSGDRISRLLLTLENINASEYISGPAAKLYLNGHERLFSEKGIKLRYMEYPQYPTYPQMSGPFEQHVSIVDLIANIGWERAPSYIWGH